MAAYTRARSRRKSTRNKTKKYNTVKRTKNGRRNKRSNRKNKNSKRGRGNYNTSTVKRRRNPPANLSGRGIIDHIKKLAKYAAKNAPAILQGARFIANQSGNKTLSKYANSRLLDFAARKVSRKFGGRGVLKPTAVKKQAKTVVNKLIKLYGRQGAQKILRSYMKTVGRGPFGAMLGFALQNILPF